MAPDAEIVCAVLRGQQDAFATLVARHERGAWAVARRVLRDDHAAADATQQAFIQAYQRLGRLRDPERFGAWLMRIARREAIREARRRAQQPHRRLEDPDDGPPDDPIAPSRQATPVSDDCEAVLDALARLPEHERVVVALRYLDGYSVNQVADAL